MKDKLLINLPEGFFSHPMLSTFFASLEEKAEVRKTSYNTPEEIEEDLKWANSIIMWSWPVLSDELLDKANITFSGNLDISQKGGEIMTRRGIPVSLARGGFSPAVAEMGVTLMLACLRRTSNYHALMWKGEEEWVKTFPNDIPVCERELTGNSVGIIGFGGIGRRISELIKGFDCDIKTYDPYLADSVAKEAGVKKVSLNEVLSESEIVVLCASSNEGSKNLIGKEEIALLKENSIFINISRAALVDTDALYERLKKKDMFAALDVFPQEPLDKNSELRKLDNVYLTPHRAGGLMTSVLRILNSISSDYFLHLEGKEIKNALTKEMVPRLDA